jgi:hypothetical protein
MKNMVAPLLMVWMKVHANAFIRIDVLKVL